MNRNKQIEEKVERTLQVTDHLEQTKVSPFFKERVMYQIRNSNQSKEEISVLWFTPKLQFGLLLCIRYHTNYKS